MDYDKYDFFMLQYNNFNAIVDYGKRQIERSSGQVAKTIEGRLQEFIIYFYKDHYKNMWE